jgi:hypothetical protein
MPPPLFSKVPSVAKLERGRSRVVSVDVKSSPRTPLGKFMKKVTSRGASSASASQSHDALHLELTLEDGVEVGRADLILLAGVDGGEVRELLEEVTRLATSNDAVGPEVGRLRRLAAELLREFRPLLLDSAELGSLPSGGGGVHCLRCYLRHVKRSLRIISHRKDDEVNRLTVRAELARLVRLAEKMEELRPLLQQEVLYNGERGGGEGRRAGRSVDKGAASFRLAQEREAAAAAARHRALLLAQLHQQSARRFWERAHRRLWQLRDAAAAAAAGGGAPPSAGTAAPPAHALPWEVFSAQFDEDYPAAALTPARGALALLRGLLRDERGGVFLGEFACFTDGDGVIDAVAKAQRAGHEPLFTSPGERSAILERTMKITRAPAPGRPPSVGAADVAHHSQVRMCLAMCGTIAKVRQTDELVVVEFAESGLLRRYSRNVQQALDLSRETGGRLDQSQITLGERHPDTVKTVDEVEKETQAAAAAEAAAAARAEAEGGGGAVARMPKAASLDVLPEASCEQSTSNDGSLASRSAPAARHVDKAALAAASPAELAHASLFVRLQRELVDEVHAVELKRRLVQEGRWQLQRLQSELLALLDDLQRADAPDGGGGGGGGAAAAELRARVRARQKEVELLEGRTQAGASELRALTARHLQRLRAAARQLSDAGDALHAEAERRAEQIHTLPQATERLREIAKAEAPIARARRQVLCDAAEWRAAALDDLRGMMRRTDGE